MPLDYATATARAGASIRARLRNATAARPGGVAVDGLFESRAVEAGIGRGMMARDVAFTCAAADATAQGIVDGSDLDVTHRGQTTRYVVDTRIDDVEFGDAVLSLRAPR